MKNFLKNNGLWVLFAAAVISVIVYQVQHAEELLAAM